jgi:lysophospholipase L1-like esterase
MPAGKSRAEVALLLASLVVALLLAEVGIRLVGPGAAASGYAPIHTGRRDRQPINALGYRDADRAQPRPEGVRRVVCLGDSFTWGVGVLFDDAWPQRIERSLSRTRGERWEAVNLAEPGMNAVQYASRLESEGWGYGPDVVVVGWVMNDSEDEDAAEARRASDWAEEQQRERSPTEVFLDRSALVRLVRTRVAATIENRRRIAGYRSMYANDDKGWTAARRALSAMGGMCRAHGVPLVVVIFPLFANPLDSRYPFAELHAKVAQAAGDAGAKVVDLLPRYASVDWRLLVVDGTNDEHPNEIAHRIAAQAIARAVDEVVARPAAAPHP